MRLLIRILIFGAIFSTSCFDLVSFKDWEEDGYYVDINPSNPNSHTLYVEIESNSGLGLVDYVKEIGSNDEYIIVKCSLNGSTAADQYFVLPKEYPRVDFKYKSNILGPFDLSRFRMIEESLEIQDIVFDTKID